MIFGHKVQLNYFKTLKEKNFFFSSFLFFGREGIGKLTFALELAKSLTLPQEILVISRNERVFQKNTNLPWQSNRFNSSSQRTKTVYAYFIARYRPNHSRRRIPTHNNRSNHRSLHP